VAIRLSTCFESLSGLVGIFSNYLTACVCFHELRIMMAVRFGVLDICSFQFVLFLPWSLFMHLPGQFLPTEAKTEDGAAMVRRNEGPNLQDPSC